MFLCRLFKSSLPKYSYKYSNVSDLKLQDTIRILKNMAPKSRENPIIMTLDNDEFKSLFTEELTSLASIFKEYGYEIRIAGGAVRDLLMGNQPKDLDFATTATPDEMKDMFTTENVRMINMKGEKHGTITPRVNDKENFEITTLRIDVVTDGRHAEVQYTTDWLLDANRRDLTINSMYLGLDGSVYDYFFGYDDLQKRRVAFVGDATTRIQEDYLRILRYFRFYGRIALSSELHEQTTLTAIKENASGLDRISGERIWTELKKILEGNFAGELMLHILDSRIAPYIGLPEICNINELQKVWSHGKNLNMNAITLISSLLNTQEEMIKLHARMKFSAFERDLGSFLVEHREPKLHSKPLHPYKKLILKGKNKDTKLFVIELLKYINSPFLQEFKEWDIPRFPVTGIMLKEKGVESGKFMGFVMNELRNYWADNDFNLSSDDLLKHLPHVVAVLHEKRKK